MTGILTSVENLISSILSVFTGIINTLLSSVQGVFAMVGTLIANIGSLAKGLVEFVLGNIVILGVLVAAFVGYSVYAQRRGQVSGGSTTRAKKSL